MTTSFVALSDTHSLHRHVVVPNADVLIHAGDFCGRGLLHEVQDFATWLGALPHKYKVVVAGNHDAFVEKNTHEARRIFAAANVQLLLNEPVQIEGFRVWGSPVTPMFCDWHFMKERGTEIARVWEQIPDDVDVLVTHGPPYGHGDLCPPYRTSSKKVAGCLDLLNRLRQIKNKSKHGRPLAHVFGHIHDGYGTTQSDEFPGTLFVNASTCNEQYRPVNKPIVFRLDHLNG
jgi:Icc-related predicted phosphoesterase